MKKIIPLSLMALSALYAQEIELDSINVESTYITEVAQKAQKSADLADALSTQVPSIDMNRRSGIANDIIIRGQKRDNISIEVDGTKVCGACPNRMDPPVSHVLASQIEDIEVIEGPYDVETFGTMSGGVKITTKKPSAKPSGEVNVGMGAWGYNKIGATISGGNDIVRALVSVSRENSEQYEDGNGDTLAEQVVKNGAQMGNQYKPANEDMDAYTKKSLMTKIFVNPLDNHELRLGYTANRSDNVLYPNTPMDAVKDDSDIYSVGYKISNISNLYKDLDIQYYKSTVVHPMSTQYRKASMMPAMDKTNDMDSSMEGLKIINTLDLAGTDMDIGLDGSERKWSGEYYNTTSGAYLGNSIDETTTKNMAVFAKLKKSFGDLDLKLGARYDSTEITNVSTMFTDRDFDTYNVNLFTNYALGKNNSIFFGAGQASRVPDARELYFKSGGVVVGTPTLKETVNTQVDLGYQVQSDSFDFKLKTFYSMLDDYIYYHKGQSPNAFDNIDATIYGAEVTSTYYATDALSIDAALSYKVGEKDKALVGQTDTDLADIAPLRGSMAVNYEYAADSLVKLEVQASDKWSDFDSDNGEQKLAGWAVANLSIKHTLEKKFDFTIGVNNIFGKTYAMSNTYSDITLITTGAGDTILLNEPGRYLYTNMNFRF
ncbi:TonB-dependent receptor [Sulfurimonas sp.]|uniref:TonB-dependent receptor n=1 Tax=Sulfurimonas sp. TaxID=2022749 RepID=UPI003564E249